MSHHDSVLDRELPDPMVDRFAAIGLERSPETIGEWIESTTDVLEASNVPTGLEAMCTADHERHEATFGGETRYFHCVLDTLLVPFVTDVDEPVTVRSRSPVSGDIVDVRVSREEIDVSPDDAVMSFGIAADVDVEGPLGGAIDPELAYELFCPYVNAFTFRDEYERWADETESAITIGITVVEGFELARALSGSPTVSPDSH